MYLVCANCHREIHTTNLYKNIDLSLYQHFDEELARELLNSLSKEYRCSKCGKFITKYSKSGLCVECLAKERQIYQRPSRDELKKLIRELSFTQIAKKYGCSDNTVRKWCDSENLPRRKTDIKKYSDEEWYSL